MYRDIITYSGNLLRIGFRQDSLEMFVSMRTFSLDDVIIPLGRTPRFGGSTHITWSVLQHSLLVYKVGILRKYPTKVLLHILLHDAHEMLTGDIISPVKDFFPDIKELQDKFDKELYRVWQLPRPNNDEIKLVATIDKLCQEAEGRILAHNKMKSIYKDHEYGIEEELNEILKHDASYEANSPAVIEFKRILENLVSFYKFKI